MAPEVEEPKIIDINPTTLKEFEGSAYNFSYF
jgi:hypothetical protein